MRLIITALLVLMATISMASDDKTEPAVKTNDTVSQTEEVKTEALAELKDKTIVYYFHGNRRCKSCVAIEEYSHEAIEASFKDELKSGVLEFSTINRDEKENEHFTKDYELYTSSLVLVKIKDGKQTEWKNLEDVWKLKGDKGKFSEYVKSEVNGYLKAE